MAFFVRKSTDGWERDGKIDINRAWFSLFSWKLGPVCAFALSASNRLGIVVIGNTMRDMSKSEMGICWRR